MDPNLFQFVVIVDAATEEEILRIDLLTDPLYAGRRYIWDGETIKDSRGDDPDVIYTRPGAEDTCDY